MNKIPFSIQVEEFEHSIKLDNTAEFFWLVEKTALEFFQTKVDKNETCANCVTGLKEGRGMGYQIDTVGLSKTIEILALKKCLDEFKATHIIQFSEAWVVKMKNDSPEVDEVKKYAAEHTLEHWPDRGEVFLITAKAHDQIMNKMYDIDRVTNTIRENEEDSFIGPAKEYLSTHQGRMMELFS